MDLPFRLYRNDPAWRPPLKSEVHALINGPKTNPWFLHARAAFWIAMRGQEVVGRISAQVDDLVLQYMGAGTGQWGMFECIDDQRVADALLATATEWLRAAGMTRMLGPFSLSIWDEPGLLVKGHEIPPTVMMGHHLPYYEALLVNAGHRQIKDLMTYELPIADGFSETANRMVAMAEKNKRLSVRRVDKSCFDQEAALILDILNDAWSANWGFVPLTDEEVAHVGKKLKPIVYEDLIRICEVDGQPVAFMMTLPDINELTADLNGSLFPFGWAKLLWRLRNPKVSRMRVPLMGVRKSHQSGRMATFMAFLMIELIRRDAVAKYDTRVGEFGWVLDDNQGMTAIAEALESPVSKIYRIYERTI
ncbi:N-acetyltransferase [Pacificimonas pallii]|uniref:N-acetyltransferase n=1 Tax=Pacificimonas pallii TaxID=2827236 RepID=UPI0034E1E256